MGAHTAVTAESKLVLSLVVGKRTQAQTKAWVHETKQRLRPGHLPVLFTEAYEGYESAILAAFGQRSPAPAQGSSGRSRRSILRWPQGLAYGPGKKQYKGRGMERGEVRVLDGKARVKHVLALLGDKQITPSVIERPHGPSRFRHQRKVRKTLAFANMPRDHRWLSWLAVGLENFCREHSSLQSVQQTQGQHRSPAMAARLTAHMWTIREWLWCPVLGGQG